MKLVNVISSTLILCFHSVSGSVNSLPESKVNLPAELSTVPTTSADIESISNGKDEVPYESSPESCLIKDSEGNCKPAIKADFLSDSESKAVKTFDKWMKHYVNSLLTNQDTKKSARDLASLQEDSQKYSEFLSILQKKELAHILELFAIEHYKPEYKYEAQSPVASIAANSESAETTKAIMEMISYDLRTTLEYSVVFIFVLREIIRYYNKKIVSIQKEDQQKFLSYISNRNKILKSSEKELFQSNLEDRIGFELNFSKYKASCKDLYDLHSTCETDNSALDSRVLPTLHSSDKGKIEQGQINRDVIQGLLKTVDNYFEAKWKSDVHYHYISIVGSQLCDSVLEKFLEKVPQELAVKKEIRELEEKKKAQLNEAQQKQAQQKEAQQKEAQQTASELEVSTEDQSKEDQSKEDQSKEEEKESKEETSEEEFESIDHSDDDPEIFCG